METKTIEIKHKWWHFVYGRKHFIKKEEIDKNHKRFKMWKQCKKCDEVVSDITAWNEYTIKISLFN